MSYLAPLRPTKLDLRQRLLNGLIDAFGDYPAKRIGAVFARHGLENDLIYNENFRKLCGGPKWLGSRGRDEACFRKYIGVRGLGDFTLITTHPVEALDYDEIVHSHVDAARWASEPRFAGYTRFASVRNPIGIINSSLFSINALTSEYIQRFVAAGDDNDEMRQKLALYKYTDLHFFEGLVAFYKKFFEEFVRVHDEYIVMRWEDLITSPAETISGLARAAGIPLELDIARQIWTQLDHVNLTGAHKHNYRRGKGKVGDWRNWITNRHLDVIRDYGFDEYMTAFGYEPVPRLDESRYSPFQRRVDALLKSGEVYAEFEDRELFGFAFNKSNIDARKFNFRSYDWRANTRIERADFRDEALMFAAWDAAELAVAELNEVLAAHLSGDYRAEAEANASLSRTERTAVCLRDGMPRAYDAIFPQLRDIVRRSLASPPAEGAAGFDDGAPPRLIGSRGAVNIVVYRGQYLGVPQSAGPMDLSTVPIETVKDIVVAPRFDTLIDRLAGGRQTAKA
jgi:hypothetical protein